MSYDTLRMHRRLTLLSRLLNERGIESINHPFLWDDDSACVNGSGYTTATPNTRAVHTTDTPMPGNRAIWELLDDVLLDAVPYTILMGGAVATLEDFLCSDSEHALIICRSPPETNYLYTLHLHPVHRPPLVFLFYEG